MTPIYAPDEPSTTGPFTGSCPPKTKRRRVMSAEQPNKCFVSEFGIDLGKSCSAEPPEELLKLSSFKDKGIGGIDGVDGSGIDNEADLILSRAGIFDWRQQPLKHMHVCKRHYQMLGRRFRETTQRVVVKQKKVFACGAPYITAVADKHPSGTKVPAAHLYVTKEHSQVMMEKQQLLVAVGDGKLLC